jgi:hypothetical protein
MELNYDQIKKIIESCHLNFLIGSGASKPYLQTLGTIEDLLTDLAAKDDDDKKTVVEASIKKHYFDVAVKGNLKIQKGTSAKLKATKENYSGFIEALNTILIKRKSNLIGKQVNLFTTNMDLFLEETLENSNVAFNDGFSGRLNPVFGTENYHNTIKKTSPHNEYQSDVPLFNLFKMHGSVNWKEKGDAIFYDYGLEILNDIDKVTLNTTDVLEIGYDDAGTWKYNSVDDLYAKTAIAKTANHDAYLEAYNKLVMINPTKEKFKTTTINYTFYELLRMYSNHLERENSVLFVFGFSFADEHICQITKRVAKSNPTLLIVIFAFCKEDKESIEKLIHNIPNVKYIYDESNTKNYSLDVINSEYFNKISDELNNPKESKKS